MELFLLLDSIFRSILVGSLYALIAIGITMVISVVRIPNFAHGELVTIGSYTTALLTKSLGFPWCLLIALATSFALSALIAISSDTIVFKPLTRRGASSLMLMVSSLAVSMGIKYSLYVVVVSMGVLTLTSNIFTEVVYTIGGGNITNLFLWAVPTTVVCALTLEFLFLRTKTGKAMRAVAENVSLARVSGISVDHIRRIAWIISGGVAGISGSFWAIYTQTNPEIGWLCLLRGFAASTIGGLSSFSGAILGGYIIGFSENFFMDVLNRFFGVPVMLKPVLTFGIMAAILIFKPTGLVLEYANIKKILGKVFLKLRRRS